MDSDLDKASNHLAEDDFMISTDKSDLDLDVIHGFLSQSYWAKGIPRDLVARSIQNTALCFGIYQGSPDKDASHARPAQVGFARVITDQATFAYLTDVFVLPKFRGRGLAKRLMRAIMEHPDLQGCRRFLLVTADAHRLYAQHGFAPPEQPGLFMEIAPGPTVYVAKGTPPAPGQS